jgi:hypothetical protein
MVGDNSGIVIFGMCSSSLSERSSRDDFRGGIFTLESGLAGWRLRVNAVGCPVLVGSTSGTVGRRSEGVARDFGERASSSSPFGLAGPEEARRSDSSNSESLAAGSEVGSAKVDG